MKKKEKSAIHGMTIEELKGGLTEIQEKLDKLRLNRAASQSRNTREARKLRAKKSVMLTILKEKELTHEE